MVKVGVILKRIIIVVLFSDLGLSKDFLKELDEMELSVKYQAQDLAFALLKIKKYQTDHYERLYNNLIKGKSFYNIKSRVIWLLFVTGNVCIH